MSAIRRSFGAVLALVRRAARELHWAMPGGPGRPDMWAEVDDLEAMRRREREVWRQGTEDERSGPPTS